MIYKVTINNKVYEVDVEEGKANLLSTQPVAAALPAAEVVPAAKAVQPEQVAPAASSASSEAQKAPMPGVVLELKVKVGQQVKENDLLLVLEAMKMENEIFSKQSGTVREIYAAKGAQVNTGDPLVLIV